MKDIAQVYTQLFNSELGQRVLEDLQVVWRSTPNDLEPTSLAHLEGQRHILRYIEAQINKGAKEKQ